MFFSTGERTCPLDPTSNALLALEVKASSAALVSAGLILGSKTTASGDFPAASIILVTLANALVPKVLVVIP